jgi:2'-5' RNA ligase
MYQYQLLRLFIGLEPPYSWLAALDQARAPLRYSLYGLRRTRAERIHLTLIFLGYIDGRRVERIADALEQAAENCDPFQLHLGSIDVFTSSRKPTIFYAGVRGELERLVHLRQALQEALNPLGFRSDGGGFTPHLTLVRIPPEQRDDVASRIGRILARAAVPPTEPFTVQRVSLIHSILKPRPARYERLANVAVGPSERGC